jgi:hypothetical protein
MGYIFSNIKTAFAVFLSAFILLGAPCNSAEFNTAEGAPNEISWIYMQSAMSGSFKKIKGKNQYILQLNGVSPFMITVAERPTRKAKVRTTGGFIRDWQTNKSKDSFKKNPPNATLVISTNGFKDVMVLKLSNPRYDKEKNTLTYKARHIQVVNKYKENDPQHTPRRKLPKRFEKAMLLIDDSWGSLGG